MAGRVAPKDLLVGMRHWVKFACHKGSKMVAFELLLWVGDLTWRACPAVQALIRPATFLASAVQLGYHTIAELQFVWDSVHHVVGPVAALKAALSQAGVGGGPARWHMVDGSGEPLLQPMLEPEGVRNAWLLKARRRTDLVAWQEVQEVQGGIA